MAFTVTVTDVLPSGSGTLRLYGTAVSDGGDVGGVVQAATTYGMRKIYCWNFVCNSGEQAARVVKSYDHATYDADILTITTQANATYDFVLEGKGS